MNLEMSPEVFTADYVGEPGARTFYVQARLGERTLSYLVEKQQVVLLAEKFRELLLMVDADDTIKSATPTRDPALRLAGPIEPEWRVGTIGLAYEEALDAVMVLIQPVAGEDESEEDLDNVRFTLRRDQVRAFILHALASAEEGRPLCQLCGLPMDPEGHNCPASNGHRPTG